MPPRRLRLRRRRSGAGRSGGARACGAWREAPWRSHCSGRCGRESVLNFVCPSRGSQNFCPSRFTTLHHLDLPSPSAAPDGVPPARRACHAPQPLPHCRRRRRRRRLGARAERRPRAQPFLLFSPPHLPLLAASPQPAPSASRRAEHFSACRRHGVPVAKLNMGHQVAEFASKVLGGGWGRGRCPASTAWSRGADGSMLNWPRKPVTTA